MRLSSQGTAIIPPGEDMMWNIAQKRKIFYLASDFSDFSHNVSQYSLVHRRQ
jgi:hypothetical protein